ncbi:hypothetical protein [Nocardioides pyridinolyticus]
MPRRLPRSARLALATVKLGVAGSIVVAGLASQSAVSSGPGYAGYPVDDTPSPESRILEKHDCSVSGFADATPLSAVVRTARGQLRHVSFDVGWEVYSRHGAAQLVAVCLDHAPAQP